VNAPTPTPALGIPLRIALHPAMSNRNGERMKLAAERLHRAARIADQAQGPDLAWTFLKVAGLMRDAAAGRLSPLGTKHSYELAEALLGGKDGEPLP
jgi:hypothetical protein